MSVAPAQPIPARGSQSSLISGYPYASQAFEDFVDDFDAVFSDAVNDLVDFAQSDLRRQAKMLPGWESVADSLVVEFDGEGFAYSVSSGDAMAEVNRLEYGDQDTAPTGFLRKTANAQSVVLGKMLAKRLSEEVPSA